MSYLKNNAKPLNGRLAIDPAGTIRVISNHQLDVKKTINDYLLQDGWKANANSNSNYSFSGLVLHSAGAVVANYVLS